jgi:hypothetical protein
MPYDFELTSKGDYKKTRDYLNGLLKGGASAGMLSELDKYGEWGVEALSTATPELTGQTAQSWNYRIVNGVLGQGIEWYNANDEYGLPVAVLIQYGHGTRNGGYVQGIDYINPAMKPVFERISEDVRKKVSREF